MLDPQEETMMAAEATHPAPSSFDALYAAMAGGQDVVLATLVEARERYKAGATRDNYVTTTSVCAAGALMASDEEMVNAAMAVNWGTDPVRPEVAVAWLLAGRSIEAAWEQQTAATTKEALALLNQTVEDHFEEELHRAVLDAQDELDTLVYEDEDIEHAWNERRDELRERKYGWTFGPIECLNQRLPVLGDVDYCGEDMPEYKATVLRVYDKAIELRQEMQPC